MKRYLNTVDLFCGAGGASTGMELAMERLGLRHRGLAINHWSVAVATMQANHPDIDTKQMSIEGAAGGGGRHGGRPARRRRREGSGMMGDRDERNDGRAETVDKVLEAMRKTLAEGDTVVEGRTITRAQFVPRDAMEAFVSLLEKTWKEEAATGGNAAKLREAAESALYLCETLNADMDYDEADRLSEVQGQLQKALSTPPRNCDKPEFATAEQARAALRRRFPVDEWSGALRMAVSWLYDTMDYCLALPVSRRFGSSQEGGQP